MSLYVFWLRKGHQLSTYATGGRWVRVIQNPYSSVQGEEGVTSHFYVRTYTIPFHVLAAFLSHSKNTCSSEIVVFLRRN